MNTNLSPNDVMEVDQEEKEEKGMDFVSHENGEESQTEMSYTYIFFLWMSVLNHMRYSPCPMALRRREKG